MDAKPQGVLRVPLLDDGAVGRPACVVFTDGSSSAPSSTATACAPATGSPTTAWSCWPRGRRPRHRPAEGGPQGTPAARPDVPRRHRRGPHHRGRGGQGRARGRCSPTTSGCTPVSSTSTTSPTASTSSHRTPRSTGASRPSATPRRSWVISPRWPTPGPRPRLDGHRHPIARLSDKPRLLFDYFSQLFAQVTNPPLDAIREELVTSLAAPSARSPTCWPRPRRRARMVVLPSRSSRQRRPGQDHPHQP